MLTPLSESLERGSMDGKGGKGNHPSILKKLQAELSLVGKKIGKKKCYALVAKL